MQTGAEPAVVFETVARLLRRHATRNLARVLDSLRPGDIAGIYRRVRHSSWKQLFQLIEGVEKRAEVLTELDPGILTEFLEQVSDDDLLELLGAMSSDDAADILESLPSERADAILALRSGADLSEAAGLLRYDSETAGGIMTPEVYALPASMTAGDAIGELQRRGDELEMVFYLYVVNEHGHLVGVCSLRELVTIPSATALGDFMSTDVVRVSTSTDQEEVARMVARYNLLAVPVVDDANKLVGLITVDDVIDVIRQEATEDMLRMAGVSETDLTERGNVLSFAKSRIPWLFASFLGGIVAVFVIGAFEEILTAVAVLAAFIPITLGMGGNVGTQSSTIVIRGIALGHVNTSRLWAVLSREIAVGALCGVVYGLFLGGIVAIVYSSEEQALLLALVVGVSVLASMIIAAVVGGSVPLLFDRLNIDPAIAAGPFVTTAVDVLGILTYFSIATALLTI